MATRRDGEKDFGLKQSLRTLLWAQGYSTRINVVLSYEVASRGKGEPINMGLTDLDVLGIRLDPGFRVHLAVADCKTATGRVPERIFWLAGVAQFFGSDANYIVRSSEFPEHVPPLARALNIALIGPAELPMLLSSYGVSPDRGAFERFHDYALQETVARKLSNLPQGLRDVERYRSSRYWMDPPHASLNRVIWAVSRLSRHASGSGIAFDYLFAECVWLYTISLWRACAALAATGLARLDQTLHLYLNGYETGVANLERWRSAFESLSRKAGLEPSLPLHPPYFADLVELVARCLRRPDATARMARRAEWVLVGQLAGGLDAPPWSEGDDDVLAEKLLDDVARFLAKYGRVEDRYVSAYSHLVLDVDRLHHGEPIPNDGDAGVPTPNPSDTEVQTTLAHTAAAAEIAAGLSRSPDLP